MVKLTQPWSAQHKQMTNHGKSVPYNLSNSFAEPLTSRELLDFAVQRGDDDLVKAYQSHSLVYTPNGGSEDLREEIAKLYGPKITKDHILVFPGAQVAVQTAAFAIVGGRSRDDNNDHNNDCHHSIVFTPGYQSLQEAPIHAGSQITRIQLSAANNWAIDPRQVQRAIQDNTKYIVLNEPYNPAGTLMTPQTQQEIIGIAKTAHQNIYILCDEVYRLLEHDSNDRLPAMCDVYDKGLSVVTLSKPWGACGVTIGWIATQDQTLLRTQLTQTQYFGTACPSRASELQAIMVLRASDLILDKNLTIIRHNLALLEQFMIDYEEWFDWVRPKAGAIAFVKFKGPLTTDELGRKLANEKYGIGIKPAYCFSHVVTDDVDYFRVGYGERVMPSALEKLREFVDEHQVIWREQQKQSG